MKPIAFIDVDGVLNRFCSNSQAKKRRLFVTRAFAYGERWKMHFDLDDKDRLLSLVPKFELSWGTTWQHYANEQIGRQIGLPELDIVAKAEFGDSNKWPGVLRAANGRPFVWFEDDQGYASVSAADPPQQPYKIIFVDPVAGLTDENIQTALNWYDEQLTQA